MANRPTHQDGAQTSSEFAARDHNGPGRGFRVGEFVIDHALGHGAMGTVYLAVDGTGHQVALKLFQEGPGVSATMLERFRREAEASKKLRRHPNIMKVYATGQEGIYHYIVMEHVHHSRTFDDLIASGTSDIPTVVRTIIKIARALHFAHSHHVIHRDVKPSNIMMDEFGEPLLTDFGVAAMNDWPGCTLTGSLTGTPLYMSPEQARAERAGPESDLYSLGVVLYEALTGSLPYTAQHASPVKSVLEAVKNELPPRPRSLRRDLSPDLEAIVMKALAKKPEDRYPDAEALAADLERALAGQHVTAHLITLRDRLLFRLLRYRHTLLAIGISSLLLGAVWLYFQLKLREAHYKYLLTTAHLKSMAEATPPLPPGAGQTQATDYAGAVARQEWFVALREINQGNYAVAAPHLGATIDLSRNIGDNRTLARAQKELARIRTLEGAHAEAMALYRLILENKDAPTADINQAHLEALIIALIHDLRSDALDLVSRPTDQGNLFRNAILCLTGEITAAQYREQIPYLPNRLQNDAYLVVAVRLINDGDTRGARRELQQVIRHASPGHEWPAPLARKLYAEMNGS